MYIVKKIVLDRLDKKAYEISDGEHTKMVVTKDILKIIKKGEVENTQIIDGTVCFIGGMQDIEIVTQYSNKQFTLLNRLVNEDNKCIGYKVKDGNGRVLRVSLNKAWELAKLQALTDVDAKIISGIKSLIGVGDLRLSEVAKEKC